MSMLNSKINFNIVIILIITGLLRGLYDFNNLFIQGLMHTLSNFCRLPYLFFGNVQDTYNVTCLIVGIFIGIISGKFIPALKNKVIELSGISNIYFNILDYLNSFLLGYAISISIYYLSASFWAYIYIFFVKVEWLDAMLIYYLCIIGFGFLHGIMMNLFIYNKIFDNNKKISFYNHLVTLILFSSSILYYKCSLLLTFAMIVKKCIKFI